MDKSTPIKKARHEATEGRPLAIWVLMFIITFWVLFFWAIL